MVCEHHVTGGGCVVGLAEVDLLGPVGGAAKKHGF